MLRIKITTFIAILAIIGVSGILSCEKEINSKEELTLKVSDFSKAGEIHNAFLTNANNNLEIVEGVNDLNEKVEIISNFNKEYAASLDLSMKDRQNLIKSLDNHKEFVLSDKLTEKSFGNSYLKSGKIEDANIFELIENLKSTSTINEETYNILNRLSLDLKSNYEYSLSDAQLKLNVLQLIGEFREIGYKTDSGEGKMLGTILALSISSIEWWEENPDAFGENLKSTKALPVWAAMDIVGGVIGAGMSVAIQASVNEEVNWEIVGYSALGGAVVGSTGIIGKAGKWLSGLF